MLKVLEGNIWKKGGCGEGYCIKLRN